MKKVFLLAIILFFVASICFANAARELVRSENKTLTANMIKWKDHDIKSYSMKVIYAAGNRPDTLFELKVENKKVVSCLRDEVPLTDLSGVKQYTIEEMHNSAKKLLKQNKKNSPMIYLVKYDETYGYIVSMVRIYNPKAKAAFGPNDFNYRIKVFDFVPEESPKK